MENEKLISILKDRFEKNMNRHENLDWDTVETKLKIDTTKLSILNKMEKTGGEPDIVSYDKKTNTFMFYDCSQESPEGRRNTCYDEKAMESRKKNKPLNNAVEMATKIGIELLTEKQYRELQQLGNFDTKTSSWIKTPSKIRKLGGAIFCDYRYDTTFVYHNSAESYYSSRGFRGSLQI